MATSETRTPDSSALPWSRGLLMDRAVFYAVATRGWQFLAGPVTFLLIGTYFSIDEQAYFYTFAGLLALQSFVELGFTVAVINVASHEWSKLGLDDRGLIVGDADARSRLFSLGRLIAKWYTAACLFFVVGVGTAGMVFFSVSPTVSPDVRWLMPWIGVVVLNTALLWTLPFAALLEGCDQVANVNRYRLLQATLGSLAVWTCIWSGAGLWAAVVSSAVRLAVECHLLLVRYRPFFRPFFVDRLTAAMSWRDEVWPLQSQMAIQGIVGYFAFSLYTPVMFWYHGTTVGGQMGMSWSILTALQAGAAAWVQTRVPKFGMLIAERNFADLDRLFRRQAFTAIGIAVAAATAIWAVFYGLRQWEHSLAERVLPPLPLAIFTVAIVVQLAGQSLAFYLRAYKRDPLAWLGVVTSTTIGLCVFVLGKQYGPVGSGLGLLGVVSLALPVRFFYTMRYRRQWQSEAG